LGALFTAYIPKYQAQGLIIKASPSYWAIPIRVILEYQAQSLQMRPRPYQLGPFMNPRPTAYLSGYLGTVIVGPKLPVRAIPEYWIRDPPIRTFSKH